MHLSPKVWLEGRPHLLLWMDVQNIVSSMHVSLGESMIQRRQFTLKGDRGATGLGADQGNVRGLAAPPDR